MPFLVHSWPRAIIHLDGDSFFTSCIQVTYPELRGKPLVTGQERGVVTAVSAEAKKMGVKRQMTTAQVKKDYPQCIIVSSNYELYGIVSHKLFEIIRRWTPTAERYSIDEGFLDITGLRRPYRASYEKIGQLIKEDVENSLGISVSVGLSVNKSLAKLASNYNKPSGFVVIAGKTIHSFLKDIPIEDVWGIGPNTTNLLKKHGIFTAGAFAQKSEEFVKKILSKPGLEIWQELRGAYILQVDPSKKIDYQSLSRIRTFTPTAEKTFLYGQLIKNLEEICTKARHYKLVTQKISIYLKGQDFKLYGVEFELTAPSAQPLDIIPTIRQQFEKIFVTKKLYRATYVILHNLRSETTLQYSLFDSIPKVNKIRAVFTSLDELREKYGNDVVHVGSSLPRSVGKKRLAIPAFFASV